MREDKNERERKNGSHIEMQCERVIGPRLISTEMLHSEWTG